MGGAGRGRGARVATTPGVPGFTDAPGPGWNTWNSYSGSPRIPPTRVGNREDVFHVFHPLISLGFGLGLEGDA
jgi:hypothetical protein